MDSKIIQIIKLAEGLSKIREIRKSIGDLSTIQDLENEIIKKIHKVSAPNNPRKENGSACGGNTPSIESLGLRTRTYTVLTGLRSSFYKLDKMSDDKLLSLGCGTVKRMRTIDDILNFPKHGWVWLDGFGKSMAAEVEEKMAAAGYPNFKITLDKGYKHP